MRCWLLLLSETFGFAVELGLPFCEFTCYILVFRLTQTPITSKNRQRRKNPPSKESCVSTVPGSATSPTSAFHAQSVPSQASRRTLLSWYQPSYLAVSRSSVVLQKLLQDKEMLQTRICLSPGKCLWERLLMWMFCRGRSSVRYLHHICQLWKYRWLNERKKATHTFDRSTAM